MNVCDPSGTRTETRSETRAPIRHLVLSSGVIYGFTFYGLLKRLHQASWFNMYDIETIHSTSAGTIIGTILSVWCIQEGSETHGPAKGTEAYDWATLDNYLVGRPWHTVFHFSLDTVLQTYQNCGMFTVKAIEDMLRPVFAARDLDLDTLTMREFYELTGIEHHFFTVNLTHFQTVDLSHHTHPEWRVLDAVYASACAPVLFAPYQSPQDHSWYVDGAFLVNYPIEPCLTWCDAHQRPRNTVLGVNICMNFDASGQDTSSPHPGMTLLEYFNLLTKNILNKICHNPVTLDPSNNVVPWEVHIHPYTRMNDFVTVCYSKDERQRLIDLGAEHAEQLMARSDRPFTTCS